MSIQTSSSKQEEEKKEEHNETKEEEEEKKKDPRCYVYVSDQNGRGRGLQANRDIKSGQVIGIHIPLDRKWDGRLPEAAFEHFVDIKDCRPLWGEAKDVWLLNDAIPAEYPSLLYSYETVQDIEKWTRNYYNMMAPPHLTMNCVLNGTLEKLAVIAHRDIRSGEPLLLHYKPSQWVQRAAARTSSTPQARLAAVAWLLTQHSYILAGEMYDLPFICVRTSDIDFDMCMSPRYDSPQDDGIGGVSVSDIPTDQVRASCKSWMRALGFLEPETWAPSNDMTPREWDSALSSVGYVFNTPLSS